MKSKILASGGILLSLALISCSENPEVTADQENMAVTTVDESAATTAELADLTEGVEGRVGFRHGLDCTTTDDCTLNFTVQSFQQLETCDGDIYGTPPPGTNLVKATILVDTTPAKTDYDPGTFTVWSEWSALTKDGLNQALPATLWCSNYDSSKNWMGSIQPGDTELRIHYMDVPEGASEIRLTETRNGARWQFALPESLSASEEPSTSPEAPASNSAGTQEAAITPIQTAAPAVESYAPVPSPAAAAPVMGFTGAPGVDPIKPLDKTISHCGDPMMYQTGTTFFTDGTTGWTETCSQQMLQ